MRACEIIGGRVSNFLVVESAEFCGSPAFALFRKRADAFVIMPEVCALSPAYGWVRTADGFSSSGAGSVGGVEIVPDVTITDAELGVVAVVKGASPPFAWPAAVATTPTLDQADSLEARVLAVETALASPAVQGALALAASVEAERAKAAATPVEDPFAHA